MGKLSGESESVRRERTPRRPLPHRSLVIVPEKLEVDGFGHQAIAVLIRMQVVAAVRVAPDSRLSGLLAERGVEIDHGVEGSAPAYPVIDALARRRPLRRVIERPPAGKHRRAVHAPPTLVPTRDELLIRFHELRRVASAESGFEPPRSFTPS